MEDEGKMPVRPPADPGGQNSSINSDDSKWLTQTTIPLQQDLLKVKAENVTLNGKLRGYRVLEQMLSKSKEEANMYKILYEQELERSLHPKPNATEEEYDLSKYQLNTSEFMASETDEPVVLVLPSNVMGDAAAGSGNTPQDSDEETAPESFHSEPRETTQAPMEEQEHAANVEDQEMEVSTPTSEEPQTRSLQVVDDDEVEDATAETPPTMTGAASLSPESISFQERLMKFVSAEREKCRKDLKNEKVDKMKLMDENEKLREEVRNLEADMQQLRARPDQDVSSSTHAEDWVHVANERSRQTETAVAAPASNQATDDDPPITKAKVKKMQEKMAKLHRANREWEEHCKRLTDRQAKEMVRLQRKLEAEKEMNNRLKESDMHRQRDFDSLLRSVKGQQSDKEKKLELELYMEKQRVESCMQRCLELERERHNWQQQVRALEVNLERLRDERRNFMQAMPSPGYDQGGATAESLKTEIGVLKLQVTTYKEDFDTERREKAKAAHEKKEVEENLKRVLEEVEKLRTENSQKTAELSRKSTRVTALEADITAQRRKIQSLEQRMERMLGAPGPYQYPGSPLQSPNPGYGGFRELRTCPPPTWHCLQCTYKNDGQRTVCEGCGTVRHDPYGQRSPALVSHGMGRGSPLDIGPDWPLPGNIETDRMKIKSNFHRGNHLPGGHRPCGHGVPFIFSKFLLEQPASPVAMQGMDTEGEYMYPELQIHLEESNT